MKTTTSIEPKNDDHDNVIDRGRALQRSRAEFFRRQKEREKLLAQAKLPSKKTTA